MGSALSNVETTAEIWMVPTAAVDSILLAVFTVLPYKSYENGFEIARVVKAVYKIVGIIVFTGRTAFVETGKRSRIQPN